MNATAAGKVPAHLWIVGVLSLLWSCVGANDYYQSVSGNLGYYQMMGMGQAELDWVNAFPAWVVSIWAIGVWVGLAGSILLLLRMRYAYYAFAISLAAMVIMTIYEFGTPHPASLDTGFAYVVTAAVLAISVALVLYSRRQAANGVLR